VSAQPSLPGQLPAAESIPWVRLYTAPEGAMNVFREYAISILDPLATAAIVLVFMVFMMINREDLRDRIIRLVGYGQLNVTTQALDEGSTRISRYLAALAVVNAAYGVSVVIGLWLIGRFFNSAGGGFPNVLVWGLLVGLFRFVPYIGIFLGASFPLLLAFALFPGYGAFFAAVGLFVALELVVAQFIEPLLYGASTGMSALAVLVAAVFWAWLWGPIGLLLSTPLTVVLVVIGRYVPQLQFLDVLLGDEPVLDPPTRLYQRLLALDQEEATELARAELEKDKSLLEVYDGVLLPALSMAEDDRNKGLLEGNQPQFIRQAMREIAEELADLNRERVKAAAEKANGNGKKVVGPHVPADCTVNVVCLPAHDDMDEVAAWMFCQLLELRGYCAYPLSQTALASEMVEAVEKRKAHAVVVSALPPAAVSHSRYLCKRLHAKYKDINLVVGLWSLRGNVNRAKERIACDGTVLVATTFAQALEAMHSVVQPAVIGAAGPAGEVSDKGGESTLTTSSPRPRP
jgi:methanogenic corrinoid protein MtbC1